MGKINSDIRTLATADIQVPRELYPRSFMPQEKDVQHLIGVDFPAITVAEVTNPEAEDLNQATYFALVDGAHRILATELQGFDEIEAEVVQLSEGDVLQEAIRRNASHGKQLSMKDKAKVARKLVEDGWKVAGLVSLLSVGERTVSRWVSDAKEAKKLTDYAKVKKLMDKGCSLAGAAREVGVARSTAKGWVDNPPQPKPKEAAPKQSTADYADPKEATKAVGQDRIDAVVEMVVEFAKDSAKELDAEATDGGYAPHWTELTEAAIKAIRKSYPKGWK
jgi:ParB-like chromosome segregation protein Spo0J